MDAGALPVVEATPRGKDQHPVIPLLSQSLHQGGHADVDISPQVETLRGIHVIQKVPEVMRVDMRSEKKVDGKKATASPLVSENKSDSWPHNASNQPHSVINQPVIPFKMSRFICQQKQCCICNIAAELFLLKDLQALYESIISSLWFE